MEAAQYYFEKARQCRRLSRVTNDARASEGLTALAEEFEAKAKAALTAERTISLLGDGIPGSLVPGQDGSAD